MTTLAARNTPNTLLTGPPTRTTDDIRKVSVIGSRNRRHVIRLGQDLFPVLLCHDWAFPFRTIVQPGVVYPVLKLADGPVCAGGLGDLPYFGVPTLSPGSVGSILTQNAGRRNRFSSGGLLAQFMTEMAVRGSLPGQVTVHACLHAGRDFL